MEQMQTEEFIKKDENIWIGRLLAKKQDDADKHTHEFIEIEYIWSGSGIQFVNDSSYYVERGDLIFIDIGDVHAYNTENEMGIINCLVTPEFFKNEFVNFDNALDVLALSCFKNYYSVLDSVPPKTRFSGKDLFQVETLLDFMIEEFNDKSEGYIETLKNYMNIFMTRIFRAMKKSQSNIYKDISKITPQILNYIEENYNDKISLKELAKNCFYSPNYFSIVFKECFGKSFMEYVNEVRVNKAKKLLKETDYSIDDVCYYIGYKDKKQFYKVFKALTGMTPRQCREK